MKDGAAPQFFLPRKSEEANGSGLHFMLFSERKACPVLVRSERTLLRLPWAVLDEREAGRARSFAVKLPAGDPRARGVRRWEVFAGPSGMPGPFERGVFRACEWMALERSAGRRRRPGGGHSFSVREVCERLRLPERPHVPSRIFQALRRLAEVSIVEHHTSGLTRPRKLFQRLAFGNYEGRPFLARHTVLFDRPFEESVLSGRARALNWELWVSLEQPIAQRLTELLDEEFSASDEPAPVTCPGAALRSLLPLEGPPGVGALRRALASAHEELLDRRYVAAVQWSGPRVRYSPGVTFQALQERMRPIRRPSPLAHALAAGLREPGEAEKYQVLVDLFDEDRLSSALSEIRTLEEHGVRLDAPRALFMDILRRGIRDAHLDWPLEESGGNGRAGPAQGGLGRGNGHSNGRRAAP